jgi:ParB-like chromosome segregation protein Spo0J
MSAGKVAARVLGPVAEVATARLRPWPGNPRRISAERRADLSRSLLADAAMLWARPLIALGDGKVICGNQRLRAAVMLGWESIPVVFVELDPVEAKVWALKDNNAWAAWDEPVLAELLAELAGESVDMILTGFTSSTVDGYLAAFAAPADPDQAPPLPAGEPSSRPGEIYQLGDHCLACGDARDPVLVTKLIRK